MFCKICKKTLSDYTSVKMGLGPVCRQGRKWEKNQKELFDTHAKFKGFKAGHDGLYRIWPQTNHVSEVL